MELLKHHVALNISIGEKFKKLWKYYLWQSCLAASALFIIILFLERDKMVVISAMGATAFIVFAMPNAVSAHSRNVIGGHLVGLISGTIFSFISLPYFYEYPLVVGIAFFAMVALDVEHPPAAGTALAVVIHEVSPNVSIIIVVAAVLLSICRYCLKNLLRDLI